MFRSFFQSSSSFDWLGGFLYPVAAGIPANIAHKYRLVPFSKYLKTWKDCSKEPPGAKGLNQSSRRYSSGKYRLRLSQIPE